MQTARRYSVWLVHLASAIVLQTIISQAQTNVSVNGPEPLPASESLSITSKVQEVNLSLVVTDKKGRFVPNLTANDITIQDNASPPDKITYFNQFTDLLEGQAAPEMSDNHLPLLHRQGLQSAAGRVGVDLGGLAGTEPRWRLPRGAALVPPPPLGGTAGVNGGIAHDAV